MSNVSEKSDNTVKVVDLSAFRFIRLFNGFTTSVQPMKITLAILIILAFYLVGGVMDMIAGQGSRVLSNDVCNFDAGSEITWVANNRSSEVKPEMDVLEFRRKTVDNFTEELKKGLTTNPLLVDVSGTNPLELIRSGKAYSVIKSKYREVYAANKTLLQERYNLTIENTEAGFDQRKSALQGNNADFDFQKRRLVEDITDAYHCLQDAMVNGNPEYSVYDLLNKVVTADVSLKDKEYYTDLEKQKEIKSNIIEIVHLARYLKVARAIKGHGIFEALVDFKLRRLHDLAVGLVLLDFERVKDNFFELVYAGSWMVKYHPLYTGILFVAGFGIYALFGGAICRISALQITREERIGPMEALRFCSKRFWSLFFVPVVPAFLVVAGVLVIALLSWILAVPVLGQIAQPLLLLIMYFIGFLMTIVVIGLAAGHGLMFPAVTVDNSDAFDAMSRAFTYILHKPWHTAFYAFLSAVYGIICYVFLRYFIFILFICVRTGVGLVLDADLLWPAPVFADFMPDIQWHLMGGGEMVSAVIFRIATLLFVLVLPGYGISFFYTTATQIYVLLRKDEDDVNMEECYLETHISELFNSSMVKDVDDDEESDTDDNKTEEQ